MRIPLLTLALLACQEALAETAASAIAYTDGEVLDILRDNPWFLPESSTSTSKLLATTDGQAAS
jgi:hypothetical protein